MATVTVTGISSNTTFTCSYGNVSDTCTVTVPVANYTLQFSQDTYTVDMINGVTVSCTLTNGGTPMSGETITFTYPGLLEPETVTATTNSNGVASHHFEGWEINEGTLTATYQGVTTTCTIVSGL